MNVKADIAHLKWPQNRLQLALLSIPAFQEWYAAQSPREMIFLGQDPDFKHFLFWNYTLRVKILRSLLKMKRMFGGVFANASDPRVIS